MIQSVKWVPKREIVGETDTVLSTLIAMAIGGTDPSSGSPDLC